MSDVRICHCTRRLSGDQTIIVEPARGIVHAIIRCIITFTALRQLIFASRVLRKRTSEFSVNRRRTAIKLSVCYLWGAALQCIMHMYGNAILHWLDETDTVTSLFSRLQKWILSNEVIYLSCIHMYKRAVQTIIHAALLNYQIIHE